MIVGTLEAGLEERDPQPIEVNLANGSLRPPLITMLACGTRTSPALMGRIRPLFWSCSADSGKYGLPAVAKNRACWPSASILKWLFTRLSNGSETAREKSSIGASSHQELLDARWNHSGGDLCKLSNRISTIAEKNREFAGVLFFHHVQNAMQK